jgi:hypothetical protein
MKRGFPQAFFFAALGALLLTLCNVHTLPSHAQTQQSAPAPTCPRPDADIVNDIYNQLKADEVLKTQWRQIIVTAKDGVVRLRGWAKGSTAVRRVVKLARDTACVKSVDSKQLSDVRKGSCPEGQKPCGDGGCIDANETCPLNEMGM